MYVCTCKTYTLHATVRTHTCIHIYTKIYHRGVIYIYVYTYVYMYVCMCMYCIVLYVCMYVCIVCLYVYYVCMYMYICTCIHV